MEAILSECEYLRPVMWDRSMDKADPQAVIVVSHKIVGWHVLSNQHDDRAGSVDKMVIKPVIPYAPTGNYYDNYDVVGYMRSDGGVISSLGTFITLDDFKLAFKPKEDMNSKDNPVDPETLNNVMADPSRFRLR